MRMLILIVLAYFLSLNTVNLFAQCEEMWKNFPYSYLDEPTLEGSPVLFPEIKLKVTRRDTGEILPVIDHA